MGAEVFRRRGMEDVPGPEGATVRIEADGTVRCRVSFPSQGQGHATAVAQVVADRLGVRLDRVRLEQVDTLAGPGGSGTFGSRGAVAIAGSVQVAADRLRVKLARLAAHRLEAAAGDVVITDGRAHVRGFPDRGVPLAEVARSAWSPPPGGLPDGLEPGLEATVHFDPREATFSGAVHVAAVEIDRDTGRVAIRRYALVEDCGPVINPLLVEGQVHGGVVQAIGQVLMEHVVYDSDGQLLTGSYMDYGLPRAGDVPSIAAVSHPVPAKTNPLGVKGCGEAGCAGALTSVMNAIADALSEYGIRYFDMPATPEKVWQAIRKAQSQ